MTKKEYFDQLEKNFKDGLKLMESKNHDYAGLEDPFKNFRLCEQLGISLEEGILVRMSDKLVRVSNLLKRDPMVVGESIADTLRDLMNYSNILLTWIQPPAHPVILRGSKQTYWEVVDNHVALCAKDRKVLHKKKK